MWNHRHNLQLIDGGQYLVEEEVEDYTHYSINVL